MEDLCELFQYCPSFSIIAADIEKYSKEKFGNWENMNQNFSRVFYTDLVIYLANWLHNGSGILKLEGLTAFPRLQPREISFWCACLWGIRVSGSHKLFRRPSKAQLDTETKCCLSPRMKASLQKHCAQAGLSTGITKLSLVPQWHCLSPVQLWCFLWCFVYPG